MVRSVPPGAVTRSSLASVRSLRTISAVGATASKSASAPPSSRRFPATGVAFGSELVIFVACIVVVPLVESTGPPEQAIWWGLVAGVTGSLGIVGLYVALSRGNMTVVAPVTGVVIVATGGFLDVTVSTASVPTIEPLPAKMIGPAGFR